MEIRIAAPDDFDAVMEIYSEARKYMAESGNPDQWGTSYPSADIVRDDIGSGRCMLVCGDGEILAVFMMMRESEPTYKIIENGGWLNDMPYITIHRVASSGRAKGIVRFITDHCKKLSDNIRIDTHEKNLTMRYALESCGFFRCGIIHVADGSPRIAYQWTAKK